MVNAVIEQENNELKCCDCVRNTITNAPPSMLVSVDAVVLLAGRFLPVRAIKPPSLI
jgi:hypothetical protein